MSEAPHGFPAHAAFKATRDANAVPDYRERVRELENFISYRASPPHP